jgi:Berberine and berberine like
VREGSEHSVVVPASFDANATDAARAWLSDSWGARAPLRIGRRLRELPDPDLPDEHRAYWRGNLERVRQVTEEYDPERLFR